LGIYLVVWWAKVNRELRDYGHATGNDLGQNPTASWLALFPGSFIVVPALVSFWRGTERVQQAARLTGVEPPNGWIALVLYLVIAPAFFAYLQVSLNKVWQAQSGQMPGAVLGAAPAGVPPVQAPSQQAPPLDR
jgi:hypothetical protein